MKKLLYTLSILLLTANCFSQTMSGTYYIGQYAPTYKTIMSAVNALSANGVSGPVLFRIYSGTYDEKIIIPQISGVSATNTITFESYTKDSTQVIITNSNSNNSQNYVIYLNGADFIKLRNLTIDPDELGYGRGVRLDNGCNNVSFLNCFFKGGGSFWMLYSLNSVDNNIEVFNNYFFESSVAIYFYGETNQAEKGLVINNNFFTNQIFSAITLKYNENAHIYKNRVEASASNTNYRVGIEANETVNPIRISSNIIKIQGCYQNNTEAIFISNQFYNSKYALIDNNNIQGVCHSGIYCGTTDCKIFNNSIILEGNKATSCLYLSSFGKNKVFNNILINNGSGTYNFAYEIHSQTSNSPYFDNNNFLTTTTANLFGINNYTTLSSWQAYSQQDSHSISKNVNFMSDSMHIQDTFMRMGIPLTEVTTDIDGEPRDPNTPYIGCDEYHLDIIPDDTVICAQKSISITAASGFRAYSWSTGQSSKTITLDSSGFGFGTHAIGITAWKGSIPFKDTIWVTFHRPVADAGMDQYPCLGDQISLSGSGGVSYYWYGLMNKKTITFQAFTTRDYHLIVTDKYGCKDTDTVSVFVMDYPIVNLGNDTAFCEGGSASFNAGTDTTFAYVWKSLPAADTISNSALFVADTSGQYRVFVTNAYGCLTKATVEVTVHPNPPKPIVNSFGASEFCDGDSVQLSAPVGYVSYLWSDGSKSSEIYVSQSSIIRLQVIDAKTCTSPFSDSFLVTVYPNPPKPNITLIGNQTFCDGDSAVLEAPIGYSHYNWSNGDSNWKQKVVKSGQFSLSLVDSNTCVSEMSDTVVIVVFPNPPKPTIIASGPVTFCERDSVILSTPSGYTSYVWSDANGDEERTITQNGSFSLHVIDSNTCQSIESDVTIIKVKPLPSIPEILKAGIDSLESSTLADAYNWYLNDTLLGLTTQLIIAPKSGNFSLITELDGCLSDESDGLYYVRSGLNEQIENSILVYPNPSDGMFYIEIVDYSNAIIQIYSSNGQLIRDLHITHTKTQIDLNNQSKGVYWIKVIGENGIYHVPLVRL